MPLSFPMKSTERSINVAVLGGPDETYVDRISRQELARDFGESLRAPRPRPPCRAGMDGDDGRVVGNSQGLRTRGQGAPILVGDEDLDASGRVRRSGTGTGHGLAQERLDDGEVGLHL